MLGLLVVNPVSMMPINGWVSVWVIVYLLTFVLELLSFSVAISESAMIFCELSG